MAVTISDLQIRNFRSCRDTSISLSTYTPIVGRNNSGKSNVIAALKWLVRRSLLKEVDYNRPSEAIEVSGKLENITATDIGALKDAKHQKAINGFVKDGVMHIKRSQPAGASKSTDVKLHVLNPESGEWADNPGGIDNAISALFPDPIHIGAMEDAAEDASVAKTSTTIGKLLAELLGTIRARHEAELNVHLDALSARMTTKGAERLEELGQIDTAINGKIRDLFPGVSVRLDFAIPELEDLVKGGTVLVYDEDDQGAEGRDIESFGHGSQRAVQMALVRYLAEVRRGQALHGGANLLLIDEPELYLHPFAVEHIREALKTLAAAGYQVVFTTHSGQMITAVDAPSTILITKSRDLGTVARPRLADALDRIVPDSDHQVSIIFTLTHAAQVFFADQVVLTEGKTEQRLLPHIFHSITGRSLGQAGVALVAQTGVNDTPKCMAVLAAMNIPAKAIVDLDFAFRGAVTHGYLEAGDADIAACKAIIVRLQEKHGFTLKDGLPVKCSGMKPAEVFARMAAEDDAIAHVVNLAAKLRERGIWIWVSGTIEAPLGLSVKTESAWRNFVRVSSKSGLDTVAKDPKAIRSLVDWMLQPVAPPAV